MFPSSINNGSNGVTSSHLNSQLNHQEQNPVANTLSNVGNISTQAKINELMGNLLDLQEALKKEGIQIDVLPPSSVIDSSKNEIQVWASASHTGRIGFFSPRLSNPLIYAKDIQEITTLIKADQLIQGHNNLLPAKIAQVSNQPSSSSNQPSSLSTARAPDSTQPINSRLNLKVKHVPDYMRLFGSLEVIARHSGGTDWEKLNNNLNSLNPKNTKDATVAEMKSAIGKAIQYAHDTIETGSTYGYGVLVEDAYDRALALYQKLYGEKHPNNSFEIAQIPDSTQPINSRLNSKVKHVSDYMRLFGSLEVIARHSGGTDWEKLNNNLRSLNPKNTKDATLAEMKSAIGKAIQYARDTVGTGSTYGYGVLVEDAYDRALALYQKLYGETPGLEHQN